MKRKKFSDYYTEEDRKNLSLPDCDVLKFIDQPFYRAFDDGVTELEVTRREYRLLYFFGRANFILKETCMGETIFGLLLITT